MGNLPEIKNLVSCILFIIYNYYTTIGDLCNSGSVHLYGFPGISTH